MFDLHRGYGLAGVAVGLFVIGGTVGLFFLGVSPNVDSHEVLWGHAISIVLGCLFILVGCMNLRSEGRPLPGNRSLKDVLK
jgi:hypothetical protein